MSKKDKEYTLEDRLIDFAVKITQVARSLPRTRTGNHIAAQLIRCGTSAAPGYGEAQGAESRSDFIVKIRMCLRGLRATKVWLIMIIRLNLIRSASRLYPIIDENDRLISIFITSIKAAKENEPNTS